MKGIAPISLACAGLWLLVLPYFLSAYWITWFFTLLLNIALVGGINLLWGFGGYLNLGYTAFFGLGAYGTALLLLRGWPLFLVLSSSLLLLLPLAGLSALIFFRLSGLYFSAATLGFLILLEEIAGKLSFLSGGHEGLTLPLGDQGWTAYWLALGLAGTSLGINLLLDRHKWGFQLRLIREDETMAGSVGIPVYWTKIKVYLIGAAIAILSGGVYVFQSGYIGPGSAFGLSVAVPPMIMVLIGGGRKWWGPSLGALFLTALQEILWTNLNHWVLSAYGLILILLGVFWARNRV
ncbi:MAG: branched-chain amino acid ABC transporter permease [Thermodesulfobacteriota bacterium]